MKLLAIGCALLGLALLTSIYFFTPLLPLSSLEQLSALQPNQKVSVSGLVLQEKHFTTSKELLLNNGLRLFCRCPTAPPAKGKNITAEGIVTLYKNNRSIEVKEYHVR